MMDRREFVKFIAITCAGMAAQSEQIAAFEHLYFANSPVTPGSLVAIDEIMISGLATRSMPLRMIFYKEGGVYIRTGCNLFGGILRWLAAPDQKIITHPSEFKWQFLIDNVEDQHLLDLDLSVYAAGHISYLDQYGLRSNVDLQSTQGSLA